MIAPKAPKPAAHDFLLEEAPPLPWPVDIDELLHEARFLSWAAYRVADLGDMTSERNHDVKAVQILARLAHEAVERVLLACGEKIGAES